MFSVSVDQLIHSAVDHGLIRSTVLEYGVHPNSFSVALRKDIFQTPTISDVVSHSVGK